MKRKFQHLFSAIILAGFTFLAFGSGDEKQSENNTPNSESKEVENKSNENWIYSNEKDKMEETEQFFANCTSVNKIDFEFPYNGGSNLNIIIRNLGKNNEVLLSISKGQFLTSVVDSESFKVKFDDEKPTLFYYNSAADGSSDVVFVSNSNRFISKIKKAKKVMIEIPFFDSGYKVFEFEVSGLKWER